MNREPSRGIKSTEFYMFAFMGCVVVLNGLPFISIPPEQITGLMMMTGLYGGLRTGEKVVAHRASTKAD